MQFYAIRHAQSENNLLYAQTGSHDERLDDPDVTPLGRQQATRLAAYLRAPGEAGWQLEGGYDPHNRTGFHLTHLYCSLMVRAVATGTIVAEALGVPLVAWADAHETGGIHYRDPRSGERVGLPGRNRGYFERNYPGLVLPAWLGDDGWWNRPFETLAERPVRALRFLGELQGRHGSQDRIAVIMHGGFYNEIMAALMSIPASGPGWFAFENTAITRIDFGGMTIVQYTNRVNHLPAEMIT